MHTLLHILQMADPGKIKQADIQAFRQRVEEQKEQFVQPTENGTLALQLAKQKGIKRLEVAIAQHIPYQEYYSSKELGQLLIDYISELSEEYWCAGWYSEIEYELWTLLHQSFEQREEFYRRVVEEDLTDLHWLATATGCWATWMEKPFPATIPLAEWHLLFEPWKVQYDAKRQRHIQPEYRDYQAEIAEWEKTISSEEKQLVDYVLKYGYCYQLPEETQALQRSFYTWAYLQKIMTTPAMLEQYGLEDNFLTQLSVGQLRKYIADRILRKHAAELLNLCPNCGRLARTPAARQCRYCHHKWD